MDIRERDTPTNQLLLPQESLSVIVAVYLDGAKGRVNFMASNPRLRQQFTKRESWMYVRHHRVGLRLFDNEWHHLALRIHDVRGTATAQLYIDGETKYDSNYLQCLPWLPKDASSIHSHESVDPGVTYNAPGASILWGYHLRASIDEISVFSAALSVHSVRAISGVGAMVLNFAAPVAMLCLTAASLILSIPLYRIFLRRVESYQELEERSTQIEEELKAEEENGDLHLNPLSLPPNQNDSQQESLAKSDAASTVAASPTSLDKETIKVDPIGMLVELKATQVAAEWRLAAKAPMADGSQKRAAFHSVVPFLAVFTSIVEAWQVLGVVAGSLTLSDIWSSAFGPVAMAFNFDFFRPTSSSFAAMFYVLAALSLGAVLWFGVMLLTNRTSSHAQLVDDIRSFIKQTRESASRGEVATHKRGPIDRISQVALHMIAFFYMPVTQLSIMAIFCRRQVMCLYDCYHDETHSALVGVGIVVLVLVTTVVPLVFVVVIFRAKAGYKKFLWGDIDSEPSEEIYWVTFIGAMRSPFTRVYGQFQPQHLYFGILMFFYKTLMSVLLVILEPESAEQLVSVVVVENLFVLLLAKQQPFLAAPCNAVVFGVHLFLLVMLGILHPLHVLTEKPAVGIVMVVLTVVFLVVCAAVLVVVLWKLACSTSWSKALWAKVGELLRGSSAANSSIAADQAVVSPHEHHVVARETRPMHFSRREPSEEDTEIQEMSPDLITLQVTANDITVVDEGRDVPLEQQDVL